MLRLSSGSGLKIADDDEKSVPPEILNQEVKTGTVPMKRQLPAFFSSSFKRISGSINFS